MSVYIFKVKYSLAIPDPDMPQPRYHTIIFARTNADGSGIIHHVTGDLVTGMRYESKDGRDPEKSATFFSKEYLGAIPISSYPAAIDQICRQQPPPPRQKSYNAKTNRTEQIKPDGTFYSPANRGRRWLSVLSGRKIKRFRHCMYPVYFEDKSSCRSCVPFFQRPYRLAAVTRWIGRDGLGEMNRTRCDVREGCVTAYSLWLFFSYFFDVYRSFLVCVWLPAYSIVHYPQYMTCPFGGWTANPSRVSYTA